MTSQPGALSDFVSTQREDYEIFVASPNTAPQTDLGMNAMFRATNIEISEGVVDELEEDVVVLFNDDELVTVSPLREFTYLTDRITELVNQNADIALGNLTLPSVLAELADSAFDVTHPSIEHPELLFTTISRCIEAQAWTQQQGQLRVGMQHLSRLTARGEAHTRAVYEQLAATDITVHVYGIPDAVPPSSLDTTIHGGWTDDFATNWFVIYQSPDSTKTSAFIAHEQESERWRGYWTFDTARIRQLTSYLEQNM